MAVSSKPACMCLSVLPSICLSVYLSLLSPFLCSSICVFPQRVMMQIVQELCRRPGLNKCGFEMPTIYIPNPQKVSQAQAIPSPAQSPQSVGGCYPSPDVAVR